MPSGAKKRKAAKKKLQNKVHNFTDNQESYSNSRGSDDRTSHDERDNDAAVIEREGNVGGGKGVSLGGGNVARGLHNGNKRRSSSSSSGSSRSSTSDDDDIVVEKEKSAEQEIGKFEASDENSGVLEVFNEAVEEKIPTEESVKEVVSLPQVSTIVSESLLVASSLTSGEIESDLNHNVDKVLQPFDEKVEVASGMKKTEEELACGRVRDDEGLSLQSSGSKAVEGCCADDDCKASETNNYSDKQPLLSSAPIPVRRTSWMDCCGLFEVFSGGSTR